MAKKKWTSKDIEYIQMISQDTVSLNLIVRNSESDEDTELGNLIQDPSLGPEELTAKNGTKEMLLTLLNELSPREEVILKMRYGFYNGRYMTLDEIGKTFNVTRERVRQIEAKAIEKLQTILKRMNMKKGDI